MRAWYHIIVYVPASHADRVREALARAGAGTMGAYDSCSFSTKGTGRFRPLAGAHPTIGVEGRLEDVEEERIEVMLAAENDDRLPSLLRAVKAVHPYEEPAIHVLPLLDYHAFL